MRDKKLFWNILLSGYAEFFAVFLLGASVYYCIEILWRGYSHITMFFAGGICFSGIYYFEKKISGIKLIYRCIIYAFLITTGEFVFGVVFNLILGLGIWDYSHRAFNILGQICPLFFVLWMLISVPAIWICVTIRHYFENKRKEIT